MVFELNLRPEVPNTENWRIFNPAAPISATITGLRPDKIPLMTDRSLYLVYMYAKTVTIMVDGKIHPMVAMIAPGKPAMRMPIKVAELMAIGPGVICAMVIRSVNSAKLSQL